MSRSLHPFTVGLRGGPRGIGFAVFGFTAATVGGGASGELGVAALGMPIAVLGFLAGVGYEFARVRRFEYELTADTLDVRSGVFARREREIPFRRIQNVDVTRDVLARLLGLATVEIETAGGGQTEATFQFLSLEAARDLQNGVRTRKRDVAAESTGAAEATAETAEAAGPVRDAESELIFELSLRDLVLLSLLSFDVRVLSMLFFVGPVVAPMLGGYVDGFDPVAGAVLGLLGVVALLGLVATMWAVGAASTFVQFYGFRLTRVGDELRYERGLIQRYDGSIPLAKIQTLTLEENVLMRRFGYAALAVETAGYAPGAGPSGGSEAAVPLAPRAEVLELAADIEPFEPPSFERPPARARRRYLVRYGLVVAGLTAVAAGIDRFLVSIPWYLALAVVLAVPFAARATWRHRGRALGEDHAFTRNGFWRRRTHVVPYYRVQTIIERRTIFQRRWDLSSVVVDTAGSRSLTGRDARAVDVGVEDAREYADAVRTRFHDKLVERRRGGRDAEAD